MIILIFLLLMNKCDVLKLLLIIYNLCTFVSIPSIYCTEYRTWIPREIMHKWILVWGITVQKWFKKFKKKNIVKCLIHG